MNTQIKTSLRRLRNHLELTFYSRSRLACSAGFTGSAGWKTRHGVADPNSNGQRPTPVGDRGNEQHREIGNGRAF